MSTYGHELSTHILYKIWCCKSSDFKDRGIWLHHQFIFPIEYFQVMAGAGFIFDLLTPVRTLRTGLAKTNKWVSLTLLLDCVNLINTRSNTKEHHGKHCLALSTLSCSKTTMHGSIAGRRKIPRERILCALSYYPVALCAQWVLNFLSGNSNSTAWGPHIAYTGL